MKYCKSIAKNESFSCFVKIESYFCEFFWKPYSSTTFNTLFCLYVILINYFVNQLRIILVIINSNNYQLY